MKTIEERAYSRYASDECCRDCENCAFRPDCLDVDYVWAFIDGAYSEHEELTRWNSPKNLPKNGQWILIKAVNDNSGNMYYDTSKFYPEYFNDIEESRHTLLGWREIHE